VKEDKNAFPTVVSSCAGSIMATNDGGRPAGGLKEGGAGALYYGALEISK